jgi:hypothetical protein
MKVKIPKICGTKRYYFIHNYLGSYSFFKFHRERKDVTSMNVESK